MHIKFLKMHGCGNDFVVFDDAANAYGWDDLARLAPRLCDRRFGVGADGIIAVGHRALPGQVWDGADYEMRYLNADGSRAEMCGNGIRCLGKFVAEELGEERDQLRILTGNGVLPIDLHREADGQVEAVTVRMGVPELTPAKVPTTLGNGGYPAIAIPLQVGEQTVQLTMASMGNPHAVAFVDAITDQHVHGLGPQIEVHPAFPARTNVEFIEVRGPRDIRMRVWERGCGETWACGTGACASVVAAILNDKAEYGTDISVRLNGGTLTVNWPAPDQPVSMTGPATTVYRGTVEV
jgi:diaminopimelate epimerase